VQQQRAVMVAFIIRWCWMVRCQHLCVVFHGPSSQQLQMQLHHPQQHRKVRLCMMEWRN